MNSVVLLLTGRENVLTFQAYQCSWITHGMVPVDLFHKQQKAATILRISGLVPLRKPPGSRLVLHRNTSDPDDFRSDKEVIREKSGINSIG
jgi:hypothetical protein